ncbi:hypothetical protein CSIM01_13880 [Colletotrichum simmondsii]|uniref:Uncharacterized protein n=1 Tax=Colletotrichum simmondsii TaxID=703756 RepID=A0A135TFH5_9PEZI|nr:hypothetical protein CSIM01_13880 [Colletotrichum simmondsii]
MPNRRPRMRVIRRICVGWWSPGLEQQQQDQHSRGEHDAGTLRKDALGPVIIASWEHDGRLRLRIAKKNYDEHPIVEPRIPLQRGAIAFDDPDIVWSSAFYHNAHLGEKFRKVYPMSAESRRLMVENYLDPTRLDRELIHDGVAWK